MGQLYLFLALPVWLGSRRSPRWGWQLAVDMLLVISGTLLMTDQVRLIYRYLPFWPAAPDAST